MEDPAASRSPVWGLVKSKNLKPRDEKRDRIPNPRNPMQYTKSDMPWSRAADKRPPAYVGIDLHKKTLQVEVQDPDGNVVSNRKVQNTPAAIRREFAAIPQDTLCVMESSSVWYERFRFIRDDLGYDTVLSNPAQTKAIAASKKKTDKVDAHILADLLRGGYIAESHVPGNEVIAARQLVRYRHDKVQQRTQCKNAIHGILLQGAVTIPGATFSNAYTQALRKMGDYRITENLKIIDCINDILARVDAKIGATVDGDPDARLLTTHTWSGQVHRTGDIVCDRRCRQVRRLALARGILRAGPDCAQLCRQGAPRQDNKKGQQARAARPSGGSPQPRAVRATLQAHAVLQAHPSQEGHLQGRSRDSFKDGTHHVPNAQEREGVLSMGTTLIFHSGQVFKQRFLYEGSGASGR